jgi:hypothetical protein
MVAVYERYHGDSSLGRTDQYPFAGSLSYALKTEENLRSFAQMLIAFDET